MKILHIIQRLVKAGAAARSMLATAKYSSKLGDFQQRVVSLVSGERKAIEITEEVGIKVINKPDINAIKKEIQQTDIVHLHFWNNPHIYQLLRSELPAMRLLIKFHIGGDRPPHIITKKLIDYADFALTTSPYTYEQPIFQNLPKKLREQKASMIYGATDFARLSGYEARPHETFNVGYIGTVSFVKMHPNYVAMNASINVPNVKFIVCGHGGENLRPQIQSLEESSSSTEESVAAKFDIRGYVENIKSVIEILDVFGYPLCENNDSTVELVLQEVMYCGVPPVIFPYGGAQRTVIHNETGLIVNNELEYKQAIEYLYLFPEERKRLGLNAQKYARENFGGENAAKATNHLYEKIMRFPKRKREWGIPIDLHLLNEPCNLGDLIEQTKQLSGAESFVESLGGKAPQFNTSMHSNDVEELLEADKKISLSPPILCRSGGGVFLYRDYYKEDGYLRFWCGLILQQHEKHNEAIAEFTEAINLGCDNWRVYWYLAQSYLRVDEQLMAEESLQKVVALFPHFTDAQALLQKVGNKNYKYYYSQGEKFFKEGNLETALANYRKAIDLNPKFAWSHLGLGKTLHRQEKVEEAIASYQKAISLNPNIPDFYHWQGELLTKHGKLEEAIASYQEALKLAPNGSHLHRGLGYAICKKGEQKIQEGITLLQKSAQINPKYLFAYTQLGSVLAAKGQFSEAATCYRKAIGLNPKSAQLHGQLAEILAELGETEEAANFYQQAVKLNPKYKTASHKLISILSTTNKACLSIVFSGRNDSYGHNFIERLISAWKRNYFELQKRDIEVEWIFIEWNPLNKNYLSYTLANMGFKCYVISPQIHEKICTNPNMTFLQFFAKNVGIRRASNDWLLVTNADVVFGSDVLDFIKNNKLNPNIIYRAERRDIQPGLYGKSFDEMTRNTVHHYKVSNIEKQFGLAAGDFILYHKDTIDFGYDENITDTDVHPDTRILANFIAKNNFTNYGSHLKFIGTVFKEDHPMSWKNTSRLKNNHKGYYKNEYKHENLPYHLHLNWGMTDYNCLEISKNVWKIGCVKLAHIINPVLVNKSSDLHIAQPITFATMKTAQQQAQGKVDVTLYTAQYPEDHAIIPEGFTKTPDLDRSILDIGKFQLPRKLPLIKDILDRLYKVAPEADYFIYTNADIALQPHFYTEVAKLIEKKYDAFIINRRTIPDHYKNVSEIPQMYAEKGEPHPGQDCFVFKRSLYEKFYLENHVIGVGFCFRSMLLNCLCHAEKFQEFRDLHLTFHIGNQEMWKDSKLQDYFHHNKNEAQKIFDYYLHQNLLPNHPLIEEKFSTFAKVASSPVTYVELPTDATAEDYYKLGQKLEKERQLDGALKAYQKAIEIDPKNFWYQHNLANIFRKQNQFQLAITTYENAIKINPKFSWSYYHLGGILQQQGKIQEAIKAYKTAVELYPNFKVYQSQLESLSQLAK